MLMEYKKKFKNQFQIYYRFIYKNTNFNTNFKIDPKLFYLIIDGDFRFFRVFMEIKFLYLIQFQKTM